MIGSPPAAVMILAAAPLGGREPAIRMDGGRLAAQVPGEECDDARRMATDAVRTLGRRRLPPTAARARAAPDAEQGEDHRVREGVVVVVREVRRRWSRDSVR